MTHVLLPVTLLLRRAYVAELIRAAVVAKAGGVGHRLIGQRFGVPSATIRGWLRMIDRRAEVMRDWFVAVAVTAGVDVSIPKATGSGCGDVAAAVAPALAVTIRRFGAGSVLGAVTPARVAVACSGGRLLSPGWPVPLSVGRATPLAPALRAGDGSSSRG